MTNFESIKYNIGQHFRDNFKTYYVILVSVLIGLVVGVYLSLTGYSYTSLLVSADKVLFDYITGSASYMSIFYTRLKDCLLYIIIIILINLTYYTSFINYIYLAYQSAMIVLSCAGLISLYRLSGILNVILFIIPVNLINLAILIYLACVSIERSKYAYKYKASFVESFNHTSLFLKLGIGAVFLLLSSLFNSLIIPLMMKSFVVINF